MGASFLSSLPKLRVLDLSGGQFQDLPEELGDLKDLVYLDLSCCFNLKILPDTVGKLHGLKYLGLYKCIMLKYLPSSVIYLTSLQVLHTGRCGMLWPAYFPSGMARAWLNFGLTIRATLEDICGFVDLTELSVSGGTQSVVKLPHNISALTKLKYLQFEYIETLPHEMSHTFKQLKQLDLGYCMNLEYLPRSFTCCGAFPALICLKLYFCVSLVEFPEVDEGALPKLRTLDFWCCNSLKHLPLSLEVLTSLNNLRLSCCEELKNSCRTNCEKSLVWRRFNIRYDI